MSLSLNKSTASAVGGLLGLPAGLALSASLGGTAGRFLAPTVLNALSLVHPSPDAVAAATIAVTSTLVPLLLRPAISSLQRASTLPAWAGLPLGLSIAAASVGHYVGSLKSLLAGGTALSSAMQQTGFLPMAIALGGVMVGMMASLPPSSKRGRKVVRRDRSGPWHADWLPMKDAKKILNDKGGLILGEACVPADEPDQVGVAQLLRWKPNGHLLTAAGSGAGKGVSVVVPNCLGYNGPLVVHDPAAETLAIVRAHREGMGRTVRVVSIEPDTDGCNVLEGLDPTSKNFSRDVRTLVSWLDAGEKGGQDNDSSFAGLAHTLCVALIMFVLTSDAFPDHERHLLKVRQLGSSPNLPELLKTMVSMRDVARGAMANAAGMVLTTMDSKETYAGVAMHFDSLTAALEGTEDILCGDVTEERRFSLTDILAGNTDFFICLPSDMLDSQPQVVRILLGALATMYLRNTSRVEHDTLFVVDEMPRLGSMQVLATARDEARKHGLYVWAIVQDLAQLEESYKKTGVRSWLASPAVLQFFGVNDLETAKMLSERCGDYTAVQESGSKSTGQSRGAGSGSTSNTKSTNTQGTKAALISPDDIMSLAVDAKGTPEEQLLFIRGRRPLRCGLPKYHRRKEMAGLVRDNPYYRPASTKANWQGHGRQIVAGIYAAGLLALAGVTAVVPPPLTAGDEAVVVGEQAAPVFWPNGATAGALAPGWRVRVVSLNRRDDGYVEVVTAGGDGVPVRVLVHRQALDVE